MSFLSNPLLNVVWHAGPTDARRNLHVRARPGRTQPGYVEYVCPPTSFLFVRCDSSPLVQVCEVVSAIRRRSHACRMPECKIQPEGGASTLPPERHRLECDWLADWLTGWLAGWLAGWLTVCMCVRSWCWSSCRLARRKVICRQNDRLLSFPLLLPSFLPLSFFPSPHPPLLLLFESADSPRVRLVFHLRPPITVIEPWASPS